MLHLLSRSLLLLILLISTTALAEDVRLDSCDGLPVVEVTVPGVKPKMRFLVDTAATSILNNKSFSSGDPNKIAVTSWRGTVETRASAVTIAELIMASTISKTCVSLRWIFRPLATLAASASMEFLAWTCFPALALL
jgi:hypothetical protein